MPAQPQDRQSLWLRVSPPRGSDSVFQNDDNFLNIIYEAYLFSLTQAAVKKTL